MADDIIPIVRWKDAVTRGLKWYFTGKPCKRGHIVLRRTSTGCVECTKLTRNARYHVDPEPARAKLRERYANNKVQHLAGQKLWREQNKEWSRDYNARYRAENAARVKVKKREWQKANYEINRDKLAADSREWYANNKEKKQTKSKEWKKNNPAKMATYGMKRRAAMRSAPGIGITENGVKMLRATQKKCHICDRRFTKADPATLDHVIPLALGGPNDDSNIALAHLSCNSGKGAKRTHLI